MAAFFRIVYTIRSRTWLAHTDGQSPILAGAMVGGPNGKGDSGTPGGVMACPSNGEDAFSKFNGNGAIHKDNVKFYSTVEPAIDFTSASLLMFCVEGCRHAVGCHPRGLRRKAVI